MPDENRFARVIPMRSDGLGGFTDPDPNQPQLVTSSTGVVAVTPNVQVAAYASGNVIGGKMTFSGVSRVAGGTGIIAAANIFSKVAISGRIDLIVFHTDPINSTFADRSAINVAPADFDKLSGVIHVDDWTLLGAAVSLGQATNANLPFKMSAGFMDAYVVAVARGSFTPTSTTDLRFVLKSLRD